MAEDDEVGEEQLEQDSPEEGFTRGYAEEDDVAECAECGKAVAAEKKVTKQIEEENYVFCSGDCAKEFEETLAEE